MKNEMKRPTEMDHVHISSVLHRNDTHIDNVYTERIEDAHFACQKQITIIRDHIWKEPRHLLWHQVNSIQSCFKSDFYEKMRSEWIKTKWKNMKLEKISHKTNRNKNFKLKDREKKMSARISCVQDWSVWFMRACALKETSANNNHFIVLYMFKMCFR